MSEFKFSVSMCVYGKDNPDHFKVAVDSILNQTRIANEVVLVVDGPVPEDLDIIIKSYANMPIFKVIRLEVNRGHGEARRIGLENCNCDYVALMDADDISLPNRFELQTEYLASNPDIDIVGGNIAEFIDSVDNIVGKRVVPTEHKDIIEYMKKRCPFNQMTVMFKKESVQKAGGYIDWFWNEDYYLWIRMRECGCTFANIGDVLVNVRSGLDMYKRRGGRKYYLSEKKLQKYMLDCGIINRKTYFLNVLKRWIIQIALPNSIRGWVFRKLARSK